MHRHKRERGVPSLWKKSHWSWFYPSPASLVPPCRIIERYIVPSYPRDNSVSVPTIDGQAYIVLTSTPYLTEQHNLRTDGEFNLVGMKSGHEYLLWRG